MITNIELTEKATQVWNNWFSVHAKSNVNIHAATLEMLNVIEEGLRNNESLVYELGSHYTQSGRPELFTLDSDDLMITTESDE